MKNHSILKFIGSGNAFNYKLGNNSAYYISGETIFIIDCGSTVFEKILENNLLVGIKNINVLITHMHSDHIGSLGDLVGYAFFKLDIVINILYPESNKLKNYLLSVGINTKTYNLIEINKVLHFKNIDITPIKQRHIGELVCFGYILNIDGNNIYYSGDSNSIPDEILVTIDSFDYFYQDVSFHDFTNNPHLSFNRLKRIINDDFRKKVWIMHLDEFFIREEAIQYGFNVVENEFGNNENYYDLLSEYKLNKRKIQILNKIGAAFSTTKDVDGLLKLILTETINLTNSDGGSIYLLDKTGKDEVLIFKHSINRSIKFDFIGDTIKVNNDSAAGYVALNGETVVLNDIENANMHYGFSINYEYDIKTNYQTKNMMIVPMKNEALEVVGVMQIINKKINNKTFLLNEKDFDDYIIPFTLDDQGIITSLASQVAVLVDRLIINEKLKRNVSLTRTTLISFFNGMKQAMSTIGEDILEEQEKFKKYATLDTLTGLMSRKEGMAFFEKQLEFAKFNGVKITVCFIDVDGLKTVNDTYGHQAGDEMLKALASIIRKTARENDTIFRYGGDEFVLLLYNVDMNTSIHIWNRIQRKFDEFNQSTDTPYNLSASYGFSEYNHLDDQGIVELIEIADKNMYKNKQKKSHR